ncbi:hypothetical protein KRP22_006555 [Phytophthora ramorum]|nr:hypothetical protein KRP22_2316 [Phytophthora ramorum]
MEAARCSRRWGPRFLRTLLLGSVLYAVLVLCWSARNVHLSGSRGESPSMDFAAVLERVHRPMANALQQVKDTVEEIQRTPSPQELEAEEHARSVPDLPSGELQWRNLTCIGWRATSDCKPDGPRDLAKDLPCDQAVEVGSSGYCEVQDVHSGELFRVMRRTCASNKKSQVFRCSDAQQFVNYHIEALDAVKAALEPGFALPNVAGKEHGRDGIVMVVYPKMVASAYATIRTLRDVLGCRLPIEIWFRQDEIDRVPRSLLPLQQLAGNDTLRAIIFREINDSRAVSFGAKVFALYNSGFDRILFLDADNVPHDAQGEVLFLHRNAKKLTGEVLYKPVNYHIQARRRIRSRWIKQGIYRVPSEEEVVEELKMLKKTMPPPLEPPEPDGIADQAVWTHMLSFRKDAPPAQYKVKSYKAAPDFPETQRCYGEREFATSKLFDMQSVAELRFSGLETHVRRFAMEAAHLRHGY